jgi:hypothetical protein
MYLGEAVAILQYLLPTSRVFSDGLRARLVPKNFHPKIFTSPLNTRMKH